MLRLCKDDDHIDLMRNAAGIARWGVPPYPDCFSDDAGMLVEQEGEIEVLIIPKWEYEYLKDCEQMLKDMSRLVGEKIEEKNNQ